MVRAGLDARILTLLVALAMLGAGCLGSGSPLRDDAGNAATELGLGVGAAAVADLGVLEQGTPINLEPNSVVVWRSPVFGDGASGPMQAPLVTVRCPEPGEGPCLQYPIVLEQDVPLFRIAAEHNDADHVYGIYLRGPSGEASSVPGGPYGKEFLVEDAEAGEWMLIIHPNRVFDGRLRIRAATMDDPTTAAAEAFGLPNARPVPPWEFSFEHPSAPASGAAGIPAGVAPSSCQAEEWVLNGYQERCLRFSFGWGTDGPGHFIAEIAASMDADMQAPIEQVILHEDGSEERIVAGTATVHAGHGHFHLDGAFHVEAFRVTDGELVPAQVSEKRGSCTLDYAIMNILETDQAPNGAAGSTCGTPAAGVTTVNPVADRLAISRGWADVYYWQLADNYVDLTGQPDGEYVLRAMVDAEEVFLETNEDDNWGYAHILVEGTSVTTIERGYGLDPWDPRKQVIEPHFAT